MRFPILHARTFSSSVRYAVSMMNFVITPNVRALAVRCCISSSMDLSSPDFSAAMLMTKSISSAPRAALARISASLISVNVTPNGKAMTVAIFTREFLSRSRAIGTYDGNMHTAAIPYSRASVQRRRMSVVVPMGRKSVWSMYRPKSDFIQNTNIGKVAIALRIIEAKTDHELIRDFESDIIQWLGVLRITRFFQQC